MTIIGPNKNAKIGSKMLFASLAALAAIAVWSIFVYNQTVNLTHELKSKEKDSQDLLTKNAELKNRRYNMTDVNNLSAIARERGFIKAAKIDYVESDHAPTLASR